MTLRVSENCLNAVWRKFKLFRDLGDTHAIVEIVDNRVGWHARTAEHRNAALYTRLGLDERAFRPVDFLFQSNGRPLGHHDSMFLLRRPGEYLLCKRRKTLASSLGSWIFPLRFNL